ncbi:MAG: phosphotransferase [Pseudomonadales bacterium]
MSDFPATPAQLTAAWLSSATGTAVSRFTIAPLGEGQGVIGQVCRVRADTADGPASYVVKFASDKPENRAVAETYDMYGREVHFYRSLSARLPVRTPRCFAAHHDPATGDFVLVLEDLASCRVGDQIAGAGLADARAVVTSLAALHAATWEKPIEGVPSHDVPAQREGIAAGFSAGWPVVEARFPELIPADVRAVAPRLAERIGDLIGELTSSPQCVVHADVRLDNILFDGNEVVLVDWQSVCTSSGEQDLAYFLTQSVDEALLATHQDSLIELYHTMLIEHGVSGHPLADCRERYATAALYLLAWAVLIAGTLDMGNERGERLARTLLSRALGAVRALGGFERLR